MENPVIFIGDSFLEVRSSKNLAAIVTQLLKVKELTEILSLFQKMRPE
jgi:hypothetical protein